MKSVSCQIRIEDGLLKEIDQFAAIVGVSRAFIFRYAISRFLKEEMREKAPFAYCETLRCSDKLVDRHKPIE